MKLSPNKLASALLAKLQALTFPTTYDGSTHPFTGQTVFSKVAAFDLEDLEAAFQELYVFTDRAAFAVLTHEAQESRVQGNHLLTVFRNDFSVLLTDRNFAAREIAQVGDASTTPGLMMISDAVVSQCSGEIALGIVCVPQGGEPFALQGEQRENQPGRLGWRQTFTLHGGNLMFSLSRAAVANYAQLGA